MHAHLAFLLEASCTASSHGKNTLISVKSLIYLRKSCFTQRVDILILGRRVWHTERACLVCLWALRGKGKWSEFH